MLMLFNKGPWGPLLPQHVILFNHKKPRVDRKKIIMIYNTVLIKILHK